MDYFNKLPTISYEGYTAKNLVVRADLSRAVLRAKEAFYPYTMHGEDRADIIAGDYYDSPRYTWLVWFSNETIDPYYDLPLSENEFFRYIENKYDSFESANRKIKFFRNNWYVDPDERITPAEFNGLAASYKKYYDPVVNDMLNVTGYRRKRIDDVVETNKIVSLTISSTNGTFTVGEEIQANTTNYASVTFANSTVVTCDKVVGNVAITGTITGQSSNASATVDSSNTLTTSIAADDALYWDPVSCYEYEQELNEYKKQIRLLDIRYAGQAENDLQRIMDAQ